MSSSASHRQVNRRSSGSYSPASQSKVTRRSCTPSTAIAARWTIEEYFKALKTGCQFERRQLESAHSLLNALAILAPVASRLLLLRHLARADPTAPASTALTAKQLEVLRAVSKRPLSPRPNARDAMRCDARRCGAGRSHQIQWRPWLARCRARDARSTAPRTRVAGTRAG